MKNLRTFDQFVSESLYESSSHRRYTMTLTKMVNYLKEIAELYRDVRFMIPADYHGQSSHECQIDEAIKGIRELDVAHKKNKDKLLFYVWNIAGKNISYHDTQNLVKGGIKAIRDLSKSKSSVFTNSPYLTTISVSMESPAINSFGQAMSNGDYGSLD